MKIRNSLYERGQSIVLIAAGFIGLLAFVALSIDGGMVLYDRRSAQNAADAAALAGAYYLAWNYNTVVSPEDLKSGIYDQVHSRAHSNYYDDADGKIVVPYFGADFPNLPNIHFVSGDTDLHHYVQVIITSTVNTSFLHFVYSGQVKNTVTAIAHIAPPTKGPPFGGSALVALSPTDCAASSGKGGGIYLSGNAMTNLIGGGMFVNSNASCAIDGPGGSYFVYTPTVWDVGGISAPANASMVVQPGPKVTKDSTPPPTQLDYPPASDFGGIPTCTGNAQLTDKGTPGVSHIAADGTSYTYRYEMSAGNWSDWNQFPGNKDIWFNSGVYCFTANGSAKNLNFGTGHFGGTDVLFYIKGNSPCNFSWSGTAVIKFSGYKLGDETDSHAGILIYIDPEGYPLDAHGSYIQGMMKFNGTSDSFIKGTIVAPNCSASLTGTNGDMYQGQMIAYNIVVSGNNTFFMDYNKDLNYKEQQPAKVDLGQ